MEDLLSKQYFEEVSSDWDKMGNSFFGNAPRDRIYDEIDIAEGQRIADIGTGSGYLLEGLTNRNLDLIAIDQSETMLNQVKTKLGDDQVTALTGTSESLPCSDKSVDVVMANMYLHHVEQPALAIKEMARITKQGGTVIFTDLDSHNHEELKIEQFDRWMGFERSDIKKWLEDAGLENIEIDCVGSDCCTSTSCGSDIAISIFVAKGIKK